MSGIGSVDVPFQLQKKPCAVYEQLAVTRVAILHFDFYSSLSKLSIVDSVWLYSEFPGNQVVTR